MNMEIAEWLEKEVISLKRLGEIAGISQGTLYAAFSQERGLSKRLAKRVSKATNWKVSVEEAMRAPTRKFKDARKITRDKCPHCGK